MTPTATTAPSPPKRAAPRARKPLLDASTIERLLTVTPRSDPIKLRNAAVVAVFASGYDWKGLAGLHVAVTRSGEGETRFEVADGVLERLGPRSRAALLAYLERGRARLLRSPGEPSPPPEGAPKQLFLSPGGKRFRPPYFTRAILRACQRAEVPLAKGWPELLRRSFAAADPAPRREEPSARATPRASPAETGPTARQSGVAVLVGRARVRELVLSVKLAANGCKDCGAHRLAPSLLTFDHLPRFQKRFTIGSGHRRSYQAVRAEIAKCELVCVPCHRRRERARGR